MQHNLSDELFMQRCIELALLAGGHAAPNPMVGSVIVHNHKIIGEGYHEYYGRAHAEVNAINAVKDKCLLKDSVLYVALEPCSHYGKTPPCCNRIVEEGIKKVVVGTTDTTAKVNGSGIDYLRKNGVEVITHVLENECRFLNRRFFTFNEKHRPYIILKWAQSADLFIAPEISLRPMKISNEVSHIRSHRWRTEESAIMVGTNTALTDNPQLTPRLWPGKAPVRLVIDRTLRIPKNMHLYDAAVKTIFYNEIKDHVEGETHFVKIDFSKNILTQICNHLFSISITSVIVEGGNLLLNSFISQNLWDEARVFTSDKILTSGIAAPAFDKRITHTEKSGSDTLSIYYNKP
ncbi:MAG: bifunctional diaminohydroxyphosphoribosylaminopyrimidine deaminase/5-amino-6-(5-phosphoribosylamino)uracil reductase RibD [Bacteroidetes bacterium]|jgi:diaminohydroxyphosphoribosylaminopyrimidine deaminase/5-amino-6-(5-phosphoribosylamino)uracil reductase|nr:bifunctional diaminohydroxyphosphoribosylaminopyrimidine deaminase/5-amino-6-(5-phosphoribosylamino)uracil reductase RibD [Bacteroidota bacterium]